MARTDEREDHRVSLVFNGDFSWLNVTDDLFRSINRRLPEYTVTLGNVDFKLANPSPGAGCGCVYPDFVDDGVVERSNAVMARLQAVAEGHPDATADARRDGGAGDA